MPEITHVEIASSKDYDELSELFLASYSSLMKKDDHNSGYTKGELDLVLPLITSPNQHLLSSGTFYILRDNSNKIVACGGWTLERPGDGNIIKNIAHIRHFATHPNAIRNGYGRRIIEHCISQARKADCISMECFASLNAEKFYTAMGFTREKATTISLRDGIVFPAILMKQVLKF